MTSGAAENVSYDELARTNAELHAVVERQQAEIESLFAQIRSLKSYIFGSRSERFISPPSSEQAPLFTLPPVAVVEETTPVPAHERRKPSGRKPLPADLPRERKEYEPEVTCCSSCNEEMPKIGEDVTEELEFVPARFKVVEHVTIKRACPRCKCGVEQGTLPKGVPVIEKGRPGPGLLAHILVSKYCDHLPLHRQEQMFKRHGIEIPRQRMCDWIGTVVEQILLLVALALKRSVTASAYIRIDETELEVQTPELPGKLHRGRLWGMLSYERDVYFEYADSRSGDVAERLLSGFQGCVQADQYSGYDFLDKNPKTIRFGCWDHARRRFFEAKESAPEHAKEALRLIGELYRIEREHKEGLKREKRTLDPAERAALRKKKSQPVLDELKTYLTQLSVSALPKSPLGKAVSYLLPAWSAFSAFVDHGIVELSNAGIEQQIRPVALGRNNWFFAGNERGAVWAAVVYSIIGTCKLNGINPYDYLTDILRRAPALMASDIDKELTPRAWKAARQNTK